MATIGRANPNHCIALCAVIATLVPCAGCALWVSDSRAITTGDLYVTDPYDGSTVYPLNIVVLGSGERIGQLHTPLRLLERRMSEESQYRVIRSADCGMLAMYANETQLAASALDQALALSKAAISDESQVAKVSGRSGSERRKMFAGEPHEVASLYIFRGLLYLARGDPENAKSCFLQASLADALAERDESRSNWLTADVLAAISFRLYGNDMRATDHLKMIRDSYPQTPSPHGWVDGAALAELKADNLTIVIVATGNPPFKYGQGALQYVEAQSKVCSARVQGAPAWPTDNVYVQAVTRGRRSMDNILVARQRHRGDTETAGSVALGVAGAVGGLAGSVVKLIAGAAIDKAQGIDIDADSRQISAIPGRFYVWASNDAMAGRELQIELASSASKPIARGAIVLPKRKNGEPRVILAWFPR